MYNIGRNICKFMNFLYAINCLPILKVQVIMEDVKFRLSNLLCLVLSKKNTV